MFSNLLQCFAMFCNVLHCFAMFCKVLQCFAMFCYVRKIFKPHFQHTLGCTCTDQSSPDPKILYVHYWFYYLEVRVSHLLIQDVLIHAFSNETEGVECGNWYQSIGPTKLCGWQIFFSHFTWENSVFRWPYLSSMREIKRQNEYPPT